ncbi:DUF4062 domain-containing protein [Glycomyces xiaoerkulensis]|uniref:DUF4062 domain-containing protein n=1 Tax=Glycomyces xiaoerkulensis TaxID=2038139 RepID=UPI000C25AFA6|nr:DUF4062 domain-containing protein [Glycomyces xiaoerkulensis]
MLINEFAHDQFCATVGNSPVGAFEGTPGMVCYETIDIMIDVMLSSTVDDLLEDRSAVVEALEPTRLVGLLGIAPVDGPSYGASAYVATLEMAVECDLYILLLGHRYGFVSDRGLSATELEYLAAYEDDPTKILIFRKLVKDVEPRQAEFIQRVGEYHRGYYIREYEDASQLRGLAGASFAQWIEERAAIGRKLDYFDHFIRLAVRKSPFPSVRPLYVVEDDYIELKYRFLSKSYTIHFDKAHIYNDFWGSIAMLESRFEEWRLDRYGRHS